MAPAAVFRNQLAPPFWSEVIQPQVGDAPDCSLEAAVEGGCRPQPHPVLIEVCESAVDDGDGTLEGAGEATQKKLKSAYGSNAMSPLPYNPHSTQK
jgi:hypothetical protein